jgi:hypothetical protein
MVGAMPPVEIILEGFDAHHETPIAAGAMRVEVRSLGDKQSFPDDIVPSKKPSQWPETNQRIAASF